MPQAETTRRASRRRELGENAPRLADVAGGGLQVREAERRAGHATRERAPRFVRRARLVEAAERFERAREVGVGAVEARFELDRHAIRQYGLLVLAREVVRSRQEPV